MKLVVASPKRIRTSQLNLPTNLFKIILNLFKTAQKYVTTGVKLATKVTLIFYIEYYVNRDCLVNIIEKIGKVTEKNLK